MIKVLDDSSINLRILNINQTYYNGKNYYQYLAYVRDKIKDHLREKLHLKHEKLFLLNNSTHCLVNVICGLSMQSISLSIEKGCYAPYSDIPKCPQHKIIPLLTHIDPNSGRVCKLNAQNFVLDAAQSAGTIAYHNKAVSAEILFFPLHKHIAIQAGAALLCVNNTNQYPEISKIAEISESGTVDINSYNNMRNQLRTNSNLFNIAYFSLTGNEVMEMADLGFDSYTPIKSHTPFVVLKSKLNIDNKILTRDPLISVKKLSDMTYRFSCYVNGSIDSDPVVCNRCLIRYLKGLL
jgi:hypothetical protein